MRSEPARGRPAVFLDRDGTLNEERDYLHRIEDFVFIAGAPEAVRRLRAAGYLVVVVTNQSGVARGYFDLAAVDRLHEYLQRELAQLGARIDAFYVCPHHPEHGVGEWRVACDCRKGEPGMLLQAARELNIDLARSWMVGDKRADVDAGLRAGVRPLLVRTGYGAGEERLLAPGTAVAVDDLAAAVDLILSGGE